MVAFPVAKRAEHAKLMGEVVVGFGGYLRELAGSQLLV